MRNFPRFPSNLGMLVGKFIEIIGHARLCLSLSFIWLYSLGCSIFTNKNEMNELLCPLMMNMNSTILVFLSFKNETPEEDEFLYGLDLRCILVA